MQWNSRQSTVSFDQWNRIFVCKQHSARCLNPEKIKTMSQIYRRFIVHIILKHTCCKHILFINNGRYITHIRYLHIHNCRDHLVKFKPEEYTSRSKANITHANRRKSRTDARLTEYMSWKTWRNMNCTKRRNSYIYGRPTSYLCRICARNKTRDNWWNTYTGVRSTTHMSQKWAWNMTLQTKFLYLGLTTS
jgi:hypothetical protein